MTYDFQITADTPEAIQFLENMRTLPFVREIRRRRSRRAEDTALPFERIPGLPYTHEERLASVREGYEDSLAGRVISHEEMGRRIASLR